MKKLTRTILPISLALLLSTPFAYASHQAVTKAHPDPQSIAIAITTLQSQIQSLAHTFPKQLQAQQKQNNAAILRLQKQTEFQIQHLQKEIQQLQVQFTKELKQVQNEVHQEAMIK